MAQGLGTNGIAALNIAIPVYSFIHGSGLMLGIGGGVLFSSARGAGEYKNSEKFYSLTVMLGILFAAIFVLLGIFCSRNIASLLGGNNETLEMSATYIKVLLLFSPAFLLNNITVAFVRNDGAPSLAMAGMLVGSFSNIILDYIFIFPCNMGIFGAVFATCLAPIISLCVISAHFIKKKNNFKICKVKAEKSIFGKIVVCGVPSLVNEISSGIVIIVFNIIMLEIAGNTGVAAYGIIANISLVVLSIYTGIAQGIQPLVSKYYGGGNMINLKKILKYAIVSCALISAVVYFIIFFGADGIASVFNKEADAGLQSIAADGMKIYFTGCIFAGINIIISIYFTASGGEKKGNAISLLRGFIIIIPTALLLSQIFNINGLWSAFPITEGIVAVIGIMMYGNFRKKIKDPI